MKISGWVAAMLVTALLVWGPLAPMAALAQSTPTGQTQPVQPLGPVEPPVTSQNPGQEAVPVNPTEKLLPSATEPVTNRTPTTGDAVGAGLLNVVYIPGKVVVCTAGFLTSTVLMLATFGSAYRAARGVFLEGCGAPWVLTAGYVSGKYPGPGDPGYDPSGN